jgi:hypothetical protein
VDTADDLIAWSDLTRNIAANLGAFCLFAPDKLPGRN